VTDHLCLCGKPIKTKEAKVCRKCRTMAFNEVRQKIIEKRMNTPRARMVQFQERRPEE
jgi:hypothetical protein